MLIQEVSPERFAELFHHYQQALAPDLAFAGDENDAHWERLPRQERIRSIAAARLALQELIAAAGEQGELRRYFAKPGEAEWGC